MVLKFTYANFEEEVINSEMPVLVDFWAEWCGPCRMVAPIVERLAIDYVGRVKVGKLNVDENRETAIALGIMSIPTIMIFKGGKVLDTIIGYQPENVFREKLERALAK